MVLIHIMVSSARIFESLLESPPNIYTAFLFPTLSSACDYIFYHIRVDISLDPPHPCDTLVSIELHISLDHPPHSFPDKTIHEPVKSAKLAFPREHHRHQVYLNDHCKNPRKNPPKNPREQKGLNFKLTPLYITWCNDCQKKRKTR